MVPDPETNFSLFMPVVGPARPGGARAIALRFCPKEDLPDALAEACRRHGFARASLRKSLGSLAGAHFAEGGAVPDHATEFLVTKGLVTPQGANLSIMVADMAGQLHEGLLLPGRNSACITVKGLLEEQP